MEDRRLTHILMTPAHDPRCRTPSSRGGAQAELGQAQLLVGRLARRRPGVEGERALPPVGPDLAFGGWDTEHLYSGHAQWGAQLRADAAAQLPAVRHLCAGVDEAALLELFGRHFANGKRQPKN